MAASADNRIKILVEAIDRATSTFSTIGGGIASLGKTAASVAAGGLAALGGGIAALGAGIAASTSKYADLESQISGIAAVMRSSSEETTQLKNLIDNLGVDPGLKVTAFDAADAIEMLGRNGLTATDILDGAARATVALSNATGGSFATSADLATDVMSLFEIEAANMATAIDGIASVTTNSKFAIDDYRLALAQGGGVAASVGVEFDDFNATMAAIAPLFASGSDAGTSFKVMLQTLIPKSKNAAGMMKELGIITTDYAAIADDLGMAFDGTGKSMAALQEAIGATIDAQTDGARGTKEWDDAYAAFLADFERNNFFDAAGNMRSMAEITGVLADATKGLSEEQMNNAFSTIFGTDAMRAAFGLARTGQDDFEALAAAMDQTSAAEMAATRVDNLKGSLEILKSVVESVQLAIGEQFAPLVRDVVERLTAWVSQNKDAIVGYFQGIAGGVSGAIAAFQEGGLSGLAEAILPEAVTGRIRGFINMLELGIAPAEAFKLSLSTLTPSGFVTLFAPLTDAIFALGEGIAGFISQISQGVPVFEAARSSLANFMPAAIANAVVSAAEGFTSFVLSVISFVAANPGQIQSWIIGIGTGLAAFSVLSTIVPLVSGLVTAFSGLGGVMGLVSGLVALLGGPVTVAIGAVAIAAGTLAVAWAENWGGIREAVAGAWAAIQPALQQIGNAVSQAFDWLLANGSTIINVISAIGVGFATFGVIQGIITLVAGLGTAFSALISVAGFLGTAFGALITGIGGLGLSLTSVGTIFSGIVALLGGPVTAAIVALSVAVGVFSLAWSENWWGIQETLATIWFENLWPVLESLRNTFTVTIPQALTILKIGWSNTWGGLLGFVESVKKGIEDFWSLLKSFFDWLMNISLPNPFEGWEMPSLSVPGFATGVSDAPQGWAVVGERGPELVRFRGGESVYNNHRSSQMIDNRQKSGPINMTVTINTDTNATAKEIADEASRSLLKVARAIGMA